MFVRQETTENMYQRFLKNIKIRNRAANAGYFINMKNIQLHPEYLEYSPSLHTQIY